MRLVDADELKNLPFERMIHTDFGDTAIPIEEIDNAQTVEITEEQAIDTLHHYGWLVIRSKHKAEAVEPRIEYGTDGQPYKLSMTNGKEYERPQGEWIYHDKLDMYYCKDCGLLEPFTKGEIEEGVKLPNFCQQCGADMRKGGAK